MRKLIFTLVVLVLASSFALADTIQGSPGAGFQSWTVSDINDNGAP